MSFWRIKLSKLFLRIPNKRLAVTATGLLLSSGAFVVVNNSSGGSSLFDLESFTRPVTFWRKMFPIYLDYRYTQWRIKDKNDEEQDDEYKKLHEK